MSIISTDLLYLLSGGASNNNPNASLGGVVSSVEVVDNTLNNLFDDVSGDEHEAGDTEYRAIFIKNNHGTDTAYNVKIWIESNTTAADDSIQIGKEADFGSPIQTIVNESTAPVAIDFSTADGQVNAISIGDMAASQVIGIWVKRIVVTGNTPQAENAATLKIYTDVV